ncbi:CCR4-NOT transcription complex subunit 10-like [Homarus americanus]|uniref:CCR4-NOT transcription complex subunit 10-like n=1 Tax=Homarus americanus TaxID=6706 RepID=A0A8J5MTW4_HOMAM|nr:CCR4-NOT transcription complex subunit 10-like [Homarus americanus]
MTSVMPEMYSAGPSSPLRGTEVVSLRVSALACSAYVSLCLFDYATALRPQRPYWPLTPRFLVFTSHVDVMKNIVKKKHPVDLITVRSPYQGSTTLYLRDKCSVPGPGRVWCVVEDSLVAHYHTV